MKLVLRKFKWSWRYRLYWYYFHPGVGEWRYGKLRDHRKIKKSITYYTGWNVGFRAGLITGK